MLSTNTSTRERRYKALLIANWDFPEDRSNLEPLRGPKGDAVALGGALTDDEVGLHDPDDVTPVLDADKPRILDELARFFADGRIDDQLLLYYSGHGRRTVDNELYLCARNTRAADEQQLRASAISSLDVSGFIASSSASATVVVLDCCFSGAFKSTLEVPGFLAGEGRFGLFSGRWYEQTPAAGPLQDVSPFTACLARALRLGTLDRDGDGFVDLYDAYAYVFHHLPPSYDATPTWVLPNPAVGTVALARARSRPPGEGAERHPLPPLVILPDGPPALVPVPPPPARPRFEMAQFLVTNRQYAEFLANPDNAGWRKGGARAIRLADASYLRHWKRGFPADQANHPVVHVSAWAAAAYAEWAGRLTGRALRLPLRREWMEAARAGRPADGFVADEVRRGGVNDAMAERRLVDVGLFAANPYGIGDLLGNAHDLCLDDHSRGQVGNDAVVLCGGAFSTTPELLTRPQPIDDPKACRGDSGFRCVARPLERG